MAQLPQAKTDAEVAKMTLLPLRTEYKKLAERYNKILNDELCKCVCCGEFISTSNGFYEDKRYNSGFYPECKKCILAQVEQRNKKTDKPNETKESVQRVLYKMDLPYVDSLYESQKTIVANSVNEVNKKSPFTSYIVVIKSLPQYRDKTWKDSEFGVDDSNNIVSDQKASKELMKDAKKHFGNYPTEDLIFLENEYRSWIQRTQVDSKSQETYVKRICFKLLDIDKAQKLGQDTEKLDASLGKLMGEANLQPKQNVGNAATDSLTFSQLIERWEQERPIPEPEPEFRDVDGIGKYIRVWFKGHLARALGLDNGYAQEYDNYIKKYTVTKNTENALDETSEDVYKKIFGEVEN